MNDVAATTPPMPGHPGVVVHPGIPGHPPMRVRPTPRQWALAMVGLVCFGLAFVGVFVPGMPTTVFLLVGSYCLTRSCPWLERRLLSSRVFRPYAEFVRSREPVSWRVRLTALVMMSCSIGVSAVVLLKLDAAPAWLLATLAACWVLATVAILRFRRAKSVERGAAAAR